MSQRWFTDVLEFHEKFCPDRIGGTPANPGMVATSFRMRLIKEEFQELVNAAVAGDLAGTADGCADLIYVAIGTAITFGIDLRPVWDEVHRSNMAKVGGGTREDGKVLKPPGWQPPDIAGVLARQPSLRGEGVADV